MRMTYTLSSQSRRVLTDHVKDIAIEFDCNDSYIYQILSEVITDPYAKFIRLFKAATRANAPVHIWLDELNTIVERYNGSQPAKSATDCLLDKIEADHKLTDTMIRSMKDGKIDTIEANRIAKRIADSRAALDATERLIQHAGNGHNILPMEVKQAARARR